MSMIITADDFTTGMHVAVHSHIEEHRARRLVRSGPGGMHAGEMLIQVPDNDDSRERPQLGVPLHVIAMELPFLYCMVVEPGGEETGPAILDTRTVRLMRVSNATLDALEEVEL